MSTCRILRGKADKAIDRGRPEPDSRTPAAGVRQCRAAGLPVAWLRTASADAGADAADAGSAAGPVAGCTVVASLARPGMPPPVDSAVATR